MQFKPGQLSAPEAAELNRMRAKLKLLEEIKVAAPLRLNRTPSGWCIEQPPVETGPYYAGWQKYGVDGVQIYSSGSTPTQRYYNSFSGVNFFDNPTELNGNFGNLTLSPGQAIWGNAVVNFRAKRYDSYPSTFLLTYSIRTRYVSSSSTFTWSSQRVKVAVPEPATLGVPSEYDFCTNLFIYEENVGTDLEYLKCDYQIVASTAPYTLETEIVATSITFDYV